MLTEYINKTNRRLVCVCVCVCCLMVVVCVCVCVCVQDKEYQCVLVIEGRTVVVDAYVETDEFNSSVFYITCQQHKVRRRATLI